MLLVVDPHKSAAPGRPAPSHGAAGSGHVALQVNSSGIAQWRTRLLELGVAIEKGHTDADATLTRAKPCPPRRTAGPMAFIEHVRAKFAVGLATKSSHVGGSATPLNRNGLALARRADRRCQPGFRARLANPLLAPGGLLGTRSARVRWSSRSCAA
jgi:hypothetical protein